MRKRNPGDVTITQQRRAEAAHKRRSKRLAARESLLAPYIKRLAQKDEQIQNLQKALQQVQSKAQKQLDAQVINAIVTGEGTK